VDVLSEAHPPNITGVKPGSGPYKSSDNTSTKYNESKMVDVLSELFLGSLPGFTPVIFGGCVV
jgi:hypothetical protein